MSPEQIRFVEPATVRPSRERRGLLLAYGVAGSGLLAWGAVWGASYTPGVVINVVGICAVLWICWCGLWAKATISADGVRSRFWRTRFVPSSEIRALDLVPRTILGASRLTVAVRRKNGTTVWLQQTTVRNVAARRALLERHLPGWQQIVGLRDVPPDDQGTP